MQTYIKLKKKMKKAHLIILGTKICHDLIFGLVIIFVEGGMKSPDWFHVLI